MPSLPIRHDMRGHPTVRFLAEHLNMTAKVLKSEGRTSAAKWVRYASRTLLQLDCELRCERAKQEFVQAMEDDRVIKL